MKNLMRGLHGIIFLFWRRKRQRLFRETVRPAPGEVLLDVGGHPSTWTHSPQPVSRIDCLNIYEVEWDPAEAPNHEIRNVLGDGCDMEYEDGAYDIAFSNSVIEHVGDWDRQVVFAAEFRRVGGRLWLQTPAYECPVEPHFLGLFAHWIPRDSRVWWVRFFTLWGWLTRPGRERAAALVDEIRLLRRSEMEELFPDCEILTERLFFVFPKSYIAVRR